MALARAGRATRKGVKMNITKQAMGAGASVALTIGLIFGCGLPASASAAEPLTLSEKASLSTSKTVPDTLSSETSPNTDEKQTRVGVIAIIGAVILAGGTAYAMGEKAALRCYHAGLRNGEWQNVKWQARAAAVGMIGPVGGGIFITGFENKFYSLV